MFASATNCPKSADGKFMFVTYEDVLKLLPVKIKVILEEYGLAEAVTEDQAMALLRLCKWNGERMSERWFSNETQLKYEAGILFDPSVTKTMSKQEQQAFFASRKENNGGYCVVCYADFGAAIKSGDKMSQPLELVCGHQFCHGCWKEWFQVNIDADSKKSLNLHCQ